MDKQAMIKGAVAEDQASDDEEYTWDDEFLYFLRTNQLEEAANLLNLRLVTNLNYQNREGNGALHFVCANNHQLGTHFLLKVLKLNYEVRNASGNSPLQWAVQNKCVDAMRVLLAHDYKIHRAASHAAEEGSWINDEELKKLEHLLDEQLKHINLSEETIKFYNIGEYGPTYEADNAIDILRKNKFGKSVLSEAFDCNNLEVLQMILEHPAACVLDNGDATTTQDDADDAPNGAADDDSGVAGAGDKLSVKGGDGVEAESGAVAANDANGGSEANLDDVQYVLHELQFIHPMATGESYGAHVDGSAANASGPTSANGGGSATVRVRELAIQDEVILNAVESQLDFSGQIIWEASIIASFWLSQLVASSGAGNANLAGDGSGFIKSDRNSSLLGSSNANNSGLIAFPHSFHNKTVLELGAGCGLLGIALWAACAHYGQHLKKLTLSDCSDRTLDNLRSNLALNGIHDARFNANATSSTKSAVGAPTDGSEDAPSAPTSNVEVVQLDWKNFDTEEKYDYIVASDLVYDSQLVDPLVSIISRLLNGWFLYAYKVSRDGAELFVEKLKYAGFEVEVQRVPREFQRNPFPDKSKEWCLMFFPDLESDDFNLLAARRSPHV